MTVELEKVNFGLNIGESILLCCIEVLLIFIGIQIVLFIRLYWWKIVKTEVIQELEYEENRTRREIERKLQRLTVCRTDIKQRQKLAPVVISEEAA